MTPQAQQIAIAVACKVIRPWTFGSFQTPNGCLLASLPDYLNDLNAMHEAEKVLTERERLQYVEESGKQSRNEFAKTGRDPRSCEDREIIYWHLSATSTQRAEAFLRALNLWKD